MQAYYAIVRGTDRYECRTFTTRSFVTKIVDAKTGERVMAARYGPEWKKEWTPMTIPTLTSADIQRRNYEQDIKEMKAKYGECVVEQPQQVETKINLYSVSWSNYGYESGSVYVYSDVPAAAILCAEEFHEYFKDKQGYLKVQRVDIAELKPETWKDYCQTMLSTKKCDIEFAKRVIEEEHEAKERTEKRMLELLAEHDKKIRKREEELVRAEEELRKYEDILPGLLKD